MSVKSLCQRLEAAKWSCVRLRCTSALVAGHLRPQSLRSSVHVAALLLPPFRHEQTFYLSNMHIELKDLSQ